MIVKSERERDDSCIATGDNTGADQRREWVKMKIYKKFSVAIVLFRMKRQKKKRIYTSNEEKKKQHEAFSAF